MFHLSYLTTISVSCVVWLFTPVKPLTMVLGSDAYSH